MKEQTSIAEKQYKKFESNIKEEDKTKCKKCRTKSNLVYRDYFTFQKYRDIDDFAAKRFPDSKLNYRKNFKDKLEFYYDAIVIKPYNEHQIEDLEKRRVVFKNAKELYNKLQNISETVGKKQIETQNVSES